MENRPAVSVIVPAYNEISCLGRCLDSLERQTLRKIELILVDDGSDDGTGEWMDRRAAEDARIVVIHRENGGLSAARNTGIKAASAQYIMFVDADDAVREDFCGLAYENITKYDADIALFGMCERSRRGRIRRTVSAGDIPEGLVDRETAMKLLCGKVGAMAWNKIYRKSLFDKVLFPEGHVFEDVATTYRLILLADRISCLGEALYDRYLRKGSITATWTPGYANEKFDARMKRALHLRKIGFDEDLIRKEAVTAAFLYVKMVRPANGGARMRIAERILRNCRHAPDFLPRKQKLLFLLYRYCRPVFDLLYDSTKRQAG